MFDTQYCHLSSHVMSVIRASNAMDSTLLVTGGTGTGKSHLAHAIHRASQKRGSGRWCKVNLATLSENLIESELFGHERGAFTGADSRRVGKLEVCNGGTVFLDEIGELPIRLQAKLLDFIQYKKICPVGANRELELDVRIIAATNRNLDAAVKSGDFRSDLYHRLNVFHVRLPELCLNPKGVIHFAKEILVAKSAAAEKKIRGFSKEVEQLFRHYSWPGNIRELENVIEFAVAMQDGPEIGLAALPATLQEYAREKLQLTSEVTSEHEEIRPSSMSQTNSFGYLELPMTLDFHETRDAFERMYLEQALRMCSGQINLTSRRIGLNKVSLTDKIRKHAIDWRKIRYDSLGPRLPIRESVSMPAP